MLQAHPGMFTSFLRRGLKGRFYESENTQLWLFSMSRNFLYGCDLRMQQTEIEE